MFFSLRLAPDSINGTETEASNHWPGVAVSRLSPTPPESLATVKSLIKSFDLGCSGGTGQSVPIHKVCRSPLSNIPTRTAPAAAVSPIQRHSTFTNPKSGGKTLSKHTDLLELPLGDLLKGRNEEMKPDPFLRKSPSLESLSKPPTLTFAGRMFTSTPSGLKPPSKLSVERKDPLAALAREYGGSKRNALLKWCQKKTEGYPNIDITNFSSSWSDGLAFCALLHTYLPAHIPYQELNSQDKVSQFLPAPPGTTESSPRMPLVEGEGTATVQKNRRQILYLTTDHLVTIQSYSDPEKSDLRPILILMTVTAFPGLVRGSEWCRGLEVELSPRSQEVVSSILGRGR
ncbi:cytospin-B-like [Pantherophis guttatus]|uniref:Cytospin-B-like n=1 Tax=Pantherophis guttatus TaxID=94885 RepID=A0A6P9B3Q3_PANGU|nr:cytospin-B-like [Pantherophis guttatus]